MDDERRRPVTDEQRQRADEAVAKLKRDLAEAAKRPRPPVTSPGKFSGWIGLDDEGNYLPPLTPEQKAHKEAVHRRAREQAATSIIDQIDRSAAELATEGRLTERLPSRALRNSDHISVDYIDDRGDTYHVLSGPARSESDLWDAELFTTAVSHLLGKATSSFIVIDFTGARSEQIAAIRSYVDGLAREMRARIVTLGF